LKFFTIALESFAFGITTSWSSRRSLMVVFRHWMSVT